MRNERVPLSKVAAAAGLLLWLAAALHLQGSEEFRLYTEDSATAEGGKTTACVWLAHGCRFRFLPPRGWAINCQATNATVLLTDPNLKAAISMMLHREPDATNAPPEPVRWRRQIQSRYPQAKLMGESPCTIARRGGWGFELANTMEKGTVALVRVVVAPYPAGVAEFEMRTTKTHERLARRATRGVLTSLTIEPVSPEGLPRR